MKGNEYYTAKQFGQSLRPPISERRVQQFLSQGRIEGAIKVGNGTKRKRYLIPVDAPDPRKK